MRLDKNGNYDVIYIGDYLRCNYVVRYDKKYYVPLAKNSVFPHKLCYYEYHTNDNSDMIVLNADKIKKIHGVIYPSHKATRSKSI